MRKFNKKFIRNAQSGFTLVELMVVIGIFLGLVALALVKIPQILANSRASGEIGELPGITAEMQRIATNRPNWSTFTLDSLIRAGAFPENRTTIPSSGAATAQNRWAGGITFASGTISNTGDIGRLTYSAVPKRECKAVVLGVSQLFRRVYVDSANSGTVGAGTPVKTDGQQLDEAIAGTACNSEANSITFDLPK